MDRKVSWIRRKDLHVLTTGNLLYTTDVRFRMLHLAGSPYWTLEVASPTLDDAGVYECQVSTQPKIYQRFYLNIIVPKAEITGTQQLFMKAGSNINITCLVTGAVRGTLIKWYHILSRPRNGVSVIELNIGDRGGVQLVTDKNRGSSWLLVSNASWKDAGNYTCAPEYSQPASITVHILNEETPAAMQHDLQPSSEGRKSILPLYHLTAIFSMLNIISIFLLEGRTWTLISQSELMRTLVCLTCLLSCLIWNSWSTCIPRLWNSVEEISISLIDLLC
ncbi:hypothetical protein SK128_021644 [Halocaridina rubra]|uniref:Ig-like domain-containing protein n=1 Tax=Halocaridina rubra TaxID=373956 RepID=A0AAN8WKZ3_HALRR